MVLKCQCCGIEREFKDGEEAFSEGWDAPPNFSTHITCDLCPGVAVVMGASHEKAHKHWAEHGRPTTFTPGLCGCDEDFTGK